MEASFRHTLPARHMRLAWPAAELFDVLLPMVAKEHWRPETQKVSSNATVSGVREGGALGTTVAICAMFKNEAPYLEEWLQYHRLLGVSKVCAQCVET